MAAWARQVQRRVATAVLVAGFVIWPCRGEAAENLLVPGADFSQLAIEKGAWCRYIVVDEALGQEDSTEVYIGLPSTAVTDRGPAFWLELATTPLEDGAGEAQVLKLLVLERITGFSEGDSLGEYVLRLYIKKGDHPAEERDPKTYEDLSLIVPTEESSWVVTGGIPVAAAGKRFTCTEKTRTVRDDREIPTGKVKLIKKSRDDYTAWFCSDVPVFRMVKCVVERWRETETVPRIPGVPVSGRQYSKTTAELTGFGKNAEPILPIDSPKR